MLGAIAGDVIGSVYENKKAWQAQRDYAFGQLALDRQARLIGQEKP